MVYLLWLFYLLSKSALIDMTPSFTDTPHQQKIFPTKIFNNSSPNWKYHSNTWFSGFLTWSMKLGSRSTLSICHLNTFHSLAFWRLRTRWSLKLGSRSFVPRPLPNPLQTGASSKHHQFTTGNCSTLLLSTLQYIANLVLHLRRPRVFPSTVVWSAMRPKNDGRLSCFILLRYSLIGVYWNHLNVHSTPNFVLRKD